MSNRELTWTREQWAEITREQWRALTQEQRERARELAAKHIIDPRTCVRWLTTVDFLDPYGEDPDHIHGSAPGRYWFVADPDVGPFVEERALRKQHPEIPNDEWAALMRAAAARRPGHTLNDAAQDGDLQDGDRPR